MDSFLISSGNFAAGAVALSLAFALVHPLDTYKTHQQSIHHPGYALSKWSSTYARSLSRGFLVSVLGAVPQVNRLFVLEFMFAR